MLEILAIIGFPSLYGGAGAELYHQIPVWEKLGVKLHFIPTQKNVRGAALYNEMLERGHVIHEAYDWNAIPENAPVISFCNEDFLAALPEGWFGAGHISRQDEDKFSKDTWRIYENFTYNHLANMYKVVDASGTRNIAYNIYNEQETDGIAVNGVQHTVTEAFDAFGRSAGYVLGKGATALDTIAHPNNILITRSYERYRDLITSMNATRGSTNVVLRGYTYDAFGRPVTRSCARQGTSRQDSFAYNDRSELASASLGTMPYAYAYDNIGNRETAQKAAQAVTTYATNPLNQYSEITQGEATPFTPEYDAAGNQTRVKTSTGIWTLVYDANNRPTSFTSEDGQTVIACGYDYMGRRFMKKVTVNGTVTLHHHYLYRGYLQIAALDLTRSTLNALWFTHWDPTQPIATRPLSIRKNATWYTYGHDLTKNVTELYKTDGLIATSYDYSPYGAITARGIDQPLQWSSEYHDAELALTYYNYRHYNLTNGCWINREPIQEQSSLNLYGFIGNNSIAFFDQRGLFISNLISATISAVVDISIQVVTNIIENKPIDRIDWVSVGAAGAIIPGGGVLRSCQKFGKAFGENNKT